MGMMNDITKIKNAKTRLITAENVYGEKGKGGMAKLTNEVPEEIIKIGQHWDGIQQAARDLGEKWKVRPCITLLPGAHTKIMDVDGPGRITHIWITVNPAFYRDLILRMYWDNEETPSVEVPLGDFFCCSWKTALRIVSIPINVNPTGGLNSYFQMPFRKHATITVENRNPASCGGFFYAISYELDEVSDEEAYFHSKFNRSNPLTYMEDYVILDDVKGKGHYVGTQIGWQQNTQGWWGEGEIKMFIDGDSEYPTYCGTGTEDYFGGAWGFSGNFTAPFLGYQDLMTINGNNRPTNSVGNRHSMYRFHILDPIRFDSDLKVQIQAIGWRSEGRYLPLMDDICSVCYWYQSEPHNPFKPIASRDELEII